MARSKNLASYEEVYWDLLEAMQGGIAEIELKLSLKQARNVQQTFYAFIRAHEHTADKLRKQGEIARCQELVQAANTMRGYMLMIHADPPVILRFINRDLNPATESIREQLKAQLTTLDMPADLPPLEQKDVLGSLFDKPLELKETQSDLPGDNEEV